MRRRRRDGRRRHKTQKEAQRAQRERERVGESGSEWSKEERE